MPRFRLSLLLLLGFFAQQSPAHAAIVTSGNVQPSNPATWTTSTAAYIGNTSDGTLTVDLGNDITSKFGYVGYDTGVSGAVTVDGAGSTWTNGASLYVGYKGSGTLDITDGGVVSSAAGYIGGTSGGLGGPPPGQPSDWTGIVSVAGAGSTWTNNGDLYVGNYGTATLNISRTGAVAVAGKTYVGYARDAVGTINFGEGSGMLTTRSLAASPSQITGTGTIEARGLVSDVNLTFDSSASLKQTLVLQSQPLRNVTLNLDLTGTPGAVGDLGAGWRGNGSLTIRNGATVNSDNGYLGYHPGSTGVATLHGASWGIASRLYVGLYGNGILDISAAGTVRNIDGYIGAGASSHGIVTVDGAGSTWTIGGEFGVGNGSLKITHGGGVHNTSPWSSISIGGGPGSTAIVAVDGAGSQWTTVANPLYLFVVGGVGSGAMYVTAGGIVTNPSLIHIAYGSGTGTVAVKGAGSSWTNGGVYIGDSGNGRMEITGGGAVYSHDTLYLDADSIVGNSSTASGAVIVDGPGSKWNNDGNLTVGSSGQGSLKVSGGGAVTNWYGTVGSAGIATVTGAGSTWTSLAGLKVGGQLTITRGGTVSSGYSSNVIDESGSMSVVTVDGSGSQLTGDGLNVGINGRATLNTVGGGAVTANSLTIGNSQSLLAIDVGSGSSLTVTNSGTLINIGTLRILAGAGAAAGTYEPISASKWSGTGVSQPVGGTWNSSSHVFTASDIQQGAAGTQVTIDLSDKQRVKVTDAASGWTLGASFLAAASPTTLGCTATPIGGTTRESLEGLLEPGKAVLGGWQFTTTSGYTAGDPAYLSFEVGAGFSRSDFSAWQYAAGAWTPFNASDLTYDGQYASFTVTDLSPYAISAVPEPASILLLGSGGLLGLFGWWRRAANQQQFGLLVTLRFQKATLNL